MSVIEAIIMGVVEGLTEYLPISSTGHLILTRYFIGNGADASIADKAFEIIIQGGAILAVLYEYRKIFWQKTQLILTNKKDGWDFFLKLFCSFLPAAVVGLLIHDFIKEKLFGLTPVILALFTGGVAMIIVERWLNKKEPIKTAKHTNNFPTWKQALGIGFFQILSMWPGTSRSMTTILGGRILGLHAPAAAEYSFFLGLPTLLAATFYDLVKNRHELMQQEGQILNLIIGIVVSFVVALVVIRWFIRFLKSKSLEAFGWYRIVLSIVFYVLFFM